ncbi:RNA-directed DNA polymerase [Rhizobium leguminosarum]|uniref:RNA-directed DNA polymerase n=1 Tax=Rhizobium leguminosarum TaxID=384 RepID=UPI000FEC2ADF|nr:RNA-directed DNA polymerase [Rhizobium leguminosarum]
MTTPQAELFVKVGILPENIPPVFTTKNLWQHFAALGTSYGIGKKAEGEHALYNASKRGGQRRVFGMPHPAFIRDAGLFYEKHWESLAPLLLKSPGSASTPTLTASGIRHVRITPHSDLPQIRLRAFSRYKFCLVTDVARFYPSVYTHSLPWAISGKQQAKAATKPGATAVLGDKLDYILRNSQSRQTIGIPVGPDVSKVAAELLMVAVDENFLDRYAGTNPPAYVRHVDDYWIAGNTREECEKHLQNLRLALRGFELDINESKTKIVSTRLVFADNWPFEFDRELIDSLRVGVDRRKNETLSILSKIIEETSESGDDGIIRHAIRVLDEEKLWGSNWELLEHFLAQCAVQFPHSFDYVARVIAWRSRLWFSTVDQKLWQDVALLTIDQNAVIGRDSEVVWALWLLKELKVSIPRKTSDSILLNSGPLPLALLAHMSANKLTADKRLKTKLRAKVPGNPIAGSFWPLTLELVHLGYGDPSWLAEADLPSSLMALHAAGASIIEWKALPKVFEEKDEPAEDWKPGYAIEDYGADYGADDDEEEEDYLTHQSDLTTSLPGIGSASVVNPLELLGLEPVKTAGNGSEDDKPWPW